MGLGDFLMDVTGTGNNFAAQSGKIYNQNFDPMLANTMGQYTQAQGSLDQIINGQTQTPGQIQLQQATENAIKQGGGAVAGMKGISPAMRERLIAENAAKQTQTAAGQGALIGAQEREAAINQKMGGANTMYSTLQNAAAANNNANVGMTSNMNNVNAGVAAQNASTKAGLVGGVIGAASNIVGGLFYDGGTVKYADGGQVSNWGYNDMPMVDNDSVANFTSKYIDSGGKALQSAIGGMGKPGAKSPMSMEGTGEFTGMPMAGGPADATGMGAPGGGGAGAGFATDPSLMMTAAHGGQIPMPVHFQHLAHIYHGGRLAAKGGTIGGKAPVPGPVDTPKNDVVPADIVGGGKAMIAPGEVVLPNSVTKSADPVQGAAEFMANELRKQGNPHGDFHEALKRAIVSRGKK